jgi:hypothetical protein
MTGREDICQTINVLCRGVDLTQVAPNAASDFVYLLDQNLKASSMLHTNSSIVGDLKPDDAAYGVKTFTIQVVVAPKRPLKL